MHPTAHVVAYWLHREFDNWSEKYEIEYKTKFHKNRVRFLLNTEQEYYFFMISWNPDYLVNNDPLDKSWALFTVVDPPKR